MASTFLGLRLNYKKHEEIIRWLEKFEDKSEESRRLLALGIQISKGAYISSRPKPIEPITWRMPSTPTVKEEKVERSHVVANIIGSFGV